MFNEWQRLDGWGLGDTALTPAQQAVAQQIVDIGHQRGMTDKQIQAALSAGWVESHYQNLPAGDRDSAGVMQQRPSQGWGSYSQVTDVQYAINAFYDAVTRVNDSGLTFGQLAQRVQRSAYPARYDQAGSIVDSILSLFGGSASPSATVPDGGGVIVNPVDGSGTPPPPDGSSMDLISGVPGWMLIAGLALAAWALLGR